jgi:hypothetical protein
LILDWRLKIDEINAALFRLGIVTVDSSLKSKSLRIGDWRLEIEDLESTRQVMGIKPSTLAIL